MLAHELFEALDRKREVRATLVADNGVNFVGSVCVPFRASAGRRRWSKGYVERLWSSDDDVRRALRHRRAFGSRCVAGANECANVDFGQIESF